MPLSRRTFLSTATAAAATPILGAAALPQTTIRLSYASAPARGLYQSLAQRFMETRPDIRVVLDSPAVDYDGLVQQTLRQNITKQLPDISHQGLNQIRPLADRGIVVPLDRFIAGDPAWKTIGVPQAMTSFASYGGKTCALPFAISVPVLFYNMDLVKKAGGDPDRLPDDWDGVIALGRKIGALGEGTGGLYVEYTNNGWSFQTLVAAFGGRMMSEDETRITFDGPAGLQALQLLQRLGKEGQPALNTEQARQAFRAGKLGILFTASSLLTGFQQSAAGNFRLKVGSLPVSSTADRLPAGGNGIVMLTDDADRQKACWEYIKFAVGPAGQKVMVEATGYVPVNLAAISDPAGLGRFFDAHPEHRIASQRLAMMTGWFSFPGENNSRIIKAIEDHCYLVVSQKQDPAAALSSLGKDVDALLPH
ncbi:ABC transporter substrate-binding protein [Bradyrhizobium brasilense]|uniref:ABC transporter substrate-binding protein n=1 Tax=Bradyrhizobium brasilense TaxID=1419277 RepID=UPI0024B26D0A|nr:ABC transporter substrate-binding protein [Bradyrhizobium australafricanum]WFU31294.1 ABC transporter substrate-binding protein [Bradyrhizobium australafricanum]